MLRIYEMFTAVQGEGILIGTPSLFIRTHGCPLTCSWCDTPETSINAKQTQYTRVELDALWAVAQNSPVKHAVLTGGEPLVQWKELDSLISNPEWPMHTTLETSGAVWNEYMVPFLNKLQLLSLSPKLHEPWDNPRKVYEATYRAHRQVKVVVSDAMEVAQALERLSKWDSVTNIIMQPEWGRGVEWATKLAEMCAAWPQEGQPWRVIPQMHKFLHVR